MYSNSRFLLDYSTQQCDFEKLVRRVKLDKKQFVDNPQMSSTSHTTTDTDSDGAAAVDDVEKPILFD